VTVLLLSVVATWNNSFLPLAVLGDPQLLPVTVGRNDWQASSTSGAAGAQLWNLVVTGSLIRSSRSSWVPVPAAVLARCLSLGAVD
jgi:multiple sugar transport system permease protein